MAVARNPIPRYAFHSLAKGFVAGDIVNTCIQELLNGETRKLNKQNRLAHRVETMKVVDTAMMDIRHLIIDIEGHSDTLFYITRDQVHTREKPSPHAKEGAALWRAGHTWQGRR